MSDLVYIVVINFKGWYDTIECLESLFRLKYTNYRIVVCDNASGDDSLERIADWANGALPVVRQNETLDWLTTPPVEKPISFLRMRAGDAVSTSAIAEKLILVQSESNLGFAGANNIGLRMALANPHVDYVWLLNNDTVVEPGALSAMLDHMRCQPQAGICGSTLLYYDDPTVVQACGGSSYNRWFARGNHLGQGARWEKAPLPEAMESLMRYVVGASMLTRRRFLEEVGLMDERYFLYFEEIDWALRGSPRFALAYSPHAIVYHKEGASIGSSTTKKQGPLAEFYLARNRLLFTWTYYPYALPSTCGAILISAMRRLSSGEWTNFISIVKGLASGLMKHQGLEKAIQL